MLDPFEITDGWFRLELVGFQALPATELPRQIRMQVEQTIDRLGLNNFRRSRERDAEKYWSRNISLVTLTVESPFVARELRRQNRLNPGDV